MKHYITIMLGTYLIFILLFKKCNGEVFTAMSDMNRLLTTESEMIRTVENYINAQEEKLRKLRRDLIEMERLHDIAAESPDDFLGNPLNAYLLVKRLTIDWADLQTTLNGDPVGQSMLANLTSMAEQLSFPDDEDLNGVALALMRLQDTYKLDISELAQGNVMGMSAYRELTAGDCFELGRQSYNSGDFYHTMLWMNEALKKHEKERNSTVDHFEIIEYLAFSTYKQGNIRQALKLTNDLLEEKPDHVRGLGNKVYYEKMLQEEELKKKGETENVLSAEESVKKGFIITEKTNPLDSWQLERMAYERLCRGESRMPPKKSKYFTCFYKYGPSPFLILARIKTEVAHINPTITLFHDVLFESEIANLKVLAGPRMKRATVQNYKTGDLETATYRISKSAWLKTEESPEVFRVNQRIEDITGLTLETAEELQVANYGIGGHYEPHFDYARREEKDAFRNLGTGNRIATFLFYMTSVHAGGATVFPNIELLLRPKKGTAAFWHNLHPSGEGDELTRHAACPVLVGQKWVSNKWIHERGQEFRRPCTLNFSDL